MDGVYGWMGKLLRVDLSAGRVWEEECLPHCRDYIGGFGLGARLAWEEIPPGVGAFDPENVLMFLSGPLTGTTAPMSGRTTVCALGPQGYPHDWFIRGSMGGRWGPELKYAGYDGVMITGRAEKPVYLWISDGRCEIRDAGHLWGKGTYATQEELLAEHGRGVRVATIGQAGENLSRIAIINTETESAVGQGGFGAVMGGKRLKALVVGGTGAVRIAQPDEFLRRSQIIAREVGTYGWPTRPALIGKSMAAKYGTRFLGCSQQCSARCARAHRRVPGVANPGKYFSGQIFCVAGRLLHGGNLPFYRFNLGVEGGFEIANLANDYGINHWDLIRAIMPYFIGCQDQELMTELDGIPIDFDSPHFWAELLRKTAFREGIGDALAEGGRRGIEAIGIGKHLIDEFYVGWGYADHWDGHRAYGNRIVFPYWLVTYLQWAVANRDPMGSGHGYGSSVMAFSPASGRGKGLTWEQIAGVGEKVYGSRATTDPHSAYQDKAIPAVWHGDRAVIKDSLSVCDTVFPRIYSTATEDGVARADEMEGPDLEYYLFTAATGLELSKEEFYRMAERVFNLDRAIQVRNFGRSRADDETVVPWFEKEEAFVNPALGVRMAGDRAKLLKLLDEYYQLRGWDLDSGRPTRRKLEELGLSFVAEELEKRGLI